MQDQLSLGIRLRDDATFENWYVGENQELLASVQNLLSSQTWCYLFLWGGKACGKSHLLQAACQQNPLSFYLPLAQEQFDSAILENLAEFRLVCIDDIEVIAQNQIWEEVLFHLFNRMQQNSSQLIISGTCSPTQLQLKLADLKSRLASGMTYQVKALNDEQKLAMLQLRSDLRGFALTHEVGRYLLTHYSRDIAELLSVLEVLDKASLQAQHRLTIPFIKTVLT